MAHPSPPRPHPGGTRALAVTLAAGLAITAPAFALADEDLQQQLNALQQAISEAPRFKTSGYFSFVGTVTDEKNGTYERITTNNPNLESASRGALQLDFRINDRSRFVTQWQAEGDKGWHVHAEWAFLAHELNSNTTVRAGRLRLPIFLYSETIDVGYTQPWASGPAELYSLLQFSSYEGADIRYRFEAAGADWTFQPFVGVARLNDWEDVPTESRGDGMHGLDITAQWGDFTAHAGYFGARMSIQAFSLAEVAYGINETVRHGIADSAASSAATGAATGAANGAATAAGNGAGNGACAGAGFVGPTLANCPATVFTPAYTTAFQNTWQSTYGSTWDSTYDTVYGNVSAGLPDPDLSVSKKDTRFWSVGLRYDNGSLLLLTEYGGSAIEGYFTDLTSCYGTVGYRFGKWMPVYTWAHMRVDDPEERRFAGSDWDPDGPGPAPAVQNPAAAFMSAAFAIDQQSSTLGLRYDLSPGIAIKAEASLVDGFTPGSSGRWIPSSPPPAPLPDEFWVYRASLDIVF